MHQIRYSIFFYFIIKASCGSCYALATISMLEARFRIHECEKLLKIYGRGQSNYSTKDALDILKKFRISVDHVIECSYYNQGCDGGYSFIVSKFFNEFEIYTDECFTPKINACYQTSCKETAPFKNYKFTVTDYFYVGGSYGKTEAKNLKMELYKNGPIVVSFEPDDYLSYYSGGIYEPPEEELKKMKFKYPSPDNGNLPEWQKVDHSVVLTGWGTEIVKGEKVEYWKLQNSWGTGWGEQGSFRIRAGKNLLGIESIGETAIPKIIDIFGKK